MMRPRMRRTLAATVLATVVVVTALGLGSSAAVADDEDGIGITVTVTPGPTDPAGSGSGAGAGSSSSGSGAGSGSGPSRGATSGSTTPADAVVPGATLAPVLGDGEVDLGGILYISGLSSAYDWSLNPFAGSNETSFTVRNVSKTTFSSTARFWMDGPFGNRISEVKGVKITDLKPGEARVVDARLGGVGQWTFVNMHATLSPPKTVDGVELDSITRDQFVVILPWAILVLAVLGGLAYAIYALVRYLSEPDDAVTPAGLAGATA